MSELIGIRRAYKRALKLSGAAITALLMITNISAAQEKHRLVVSSILLDNTPNTSVQDWFLDELVKRSNGRIELEQYRAGSLCNGQETTTCVMDGRADIGITVPAYSPQQFVLAELGTLPFLTSDNAAQMRAFYELNNSNQAFRSETTKIGLKPVAYFSAGLSVLGSKTPLSGPDDLKGLRIRAIGDGVVTSVRAVDAQPVAVTASEMYEAAERGIVDVVFNNMDAPTAYNLDEVLPYWADAGYGHYTLIGIWMAQSTYDNLPEDLQKIVDGVIYDLNTGAGAEAFAATARLQCDQLVNGGQVKGFTIWDEAAKESWAQQTGDGPMKRFVEKAQAANYDAPDQIVTEYEALLAQYSAPDAVTPITECADRFKAM